jgi:hypothetical protein
MEKVTISVALFTQIAQYLETKPFNEVNRFFVAFDKELGGQQKPPEVPPAE